MTVIDYVPRKFYFWGIFKEEDTIKRILHVTPKSMTEAKLDGCKELQMKKGYITDFSDLNESQFLKLLGNLAIIEMGYLLCEGYVTAKDNSQERCLYYKPRRVVIDEARSHGSSYCI